MAHIRSMLYAVGGGGGIGNIVKNGIVQNPNSGITIQTTTKMNSSSSYYTAISNSLPFNGTNAVTGIFNPRVQSNYTSCNGLNSWWKSTNHVANSLLYYSIPTSLVDKYKYFDIHPIVSSGNPNYVSGVTFQIKVTAVYGSRQQIIAEVSKNIPASLSINQLYKKIPTSIELSGRIYKLSQIQIYVGNNEYGSSSQNHDRIVDTFRLNTLNFHN